MPDPTQLVPRQSALDGHLPSAGSATLDADTLTLSHPRPNAMLELMGTPPSAQLQACLSGVGLTDAPAFGRCASGAGVRLLGIGPDRYMVVTERSPADVLAAFEAALRDTECTLVDVSHARICLRLQGRYAQDVLAKGTPLDLSTLTPGVVAATVLSHFSVFLHADEGATYDIYVTRSFGLSCYEWLCAAGREYQMVVAA